MHYKNGREAHNGDPVISKQYNSVVAGTLHSTTASSESCNGQLAVSIPGGVTQYCVTIKECWHAEDALANCEATLQPPAAAPELGSQCCGAGVKA